jgi:hypothetical protein
MTPIEAIHQTYEQITGLSIKLPVHERAIGDFLAHGFTQEEFALVLRHLVRENKRMNGAAYSLRIDRLIDYEYRRLDSLLSEAKALERNRPKQSPAENVLAQFRGTTATRNTDTARPAASMELIQALRKATE